MEDSQRRRRMSFGLGAAVGQPESQVFQDPADHLGVFDCGHVAHFF